jgi:signal transduction histidine kinase
MTRSGHAQAARHASSQKEQKALCHQEHGCVRNGSDPAMASRPCTSRSIESGLPLILAMVVVVASFTGSLGYSHLRLAAIEQDANSLESTITPGMESLADARRDLLSLSVDASALLLGPAAQRAATRQRMLDERDELDGALNRYLTMPTLPGEAPLQTHALKQLEPLDDALHDVLVDAATAVQSEERDADVERFDSALDGLGGDLQHLLDLNVAAVRSDADAILATRASARRVAIALGAFSLLAALIATVLALKTQQAQAQLLAEHRVFLEHRAQELEAFAGRVAHDLRSPLATMALQVASAQSRAAPESPVHGLALKLVQRVDGMNRIIEDLLHFASSGARPAPGAHTDLQQLLLEVASELQPAVEAAGVELRVELRIENSGPLDIACSHGALRSVLTNLLQNAVTHMQAGSRRARSINARALADEGKVRVEIEDTGPGLPPGTEQSVFEPFVQLDRGIGRGIGLGLATVKKIVEAHGGRVGVQSTFGQGSCFWFELPRPHAVSASA